MSDQALNLQTPATVWWVILLIGIAFIVGGLAIALNRIQERRPPRPVGIGNELAKKPGTYGSRKVMDPNGPFPRCVPMIISEGVCRNCFRPIDDESPKACPASNPMDRFRLEWEVETMVRSDAKKEE